MRYNYPLIQYKTINYKAALICINEGTEKIHRLFDLETWNLRINKKEIELEVDHAHLNQFVIQTWDKQFKYTLRNWIALNQDNYAKYIELKDECERISFLENILRGNILSFAKGIQVFFDKQVIVKNLELKKNRKISYKEASLLSFDISFRSNVFLPNYIGLGKGTSLGFGVVKQFRKEKNEE